MTEFTFPNVVVALLLTVIIVCGIRAMLKIEHDIRIHKAATHHLQMQNEEVARRWREYCMANGIHE